MEAVRGRIKGDRLFLCSKGSRRWFGSVRHDVDQTAQGVEMCCIPRVTAVMCVRGVRVCVCVCVCVCVMCVCVCVCMFVCMYIHMYTYVYMYI
jgi:hypothetical protein